jgi:hypothetical protein
MYAILMVDSMASRYGMLPTEVLAKANTVDVFILEQALAYHNRAKDPDYDPSKPTLPKLSQATMKAMIERVRKEQR